MAKNNAINANTATPLSADIGGSGVSSPTANGVLIANGASAFSSQVLTDGQLLIGDTGAAPVAASITAGAGLSVTPGAGSLTIALTAPPANAWVTVTGSSQSMAVNTGYTANNPSATINMLLPAASAIGDWVSIDNKGVAGFRVTQASGQVIHFSGVSTTVGTGGSMEIIEIYDSLSLRALENDGSAWIVTSAIGTFNIT